jgi:serine/threonine protein phosphatase PrpC
MAETIEIASTPDIACQNLIIKAKENGGEDNISVILVAKGWPLPSGDRPMSGESGPRRPSNET